MADNAALSGGPQAGRSPAGLIVGGSVSFDRAADFYDVTRALPTHIARKLTDALVVELAAANATHVLEVGIGTGRISRPLAERGVRVCGVDIALRMLARLRDQLDTQHVSPDLLRADTTRLPIASGSFRAVLVFHVLHLVSSVEAAAGELARVLAPGGLLIHGRTSFLGENPWDAYIAKWNELMPSPSPVRRTRPRLEEIQGALAAVGGTCRLTPFAEDETRETPTQNLERVRQRTDSWSWEIPDDVFDETLAKLEPWYRRHYKDMDQDLTQRVSYELELWRFSG